LCSKIWRDLSTRFCLRNLVEDPP